MNLFAQSGEELAQASARQRVHMTRERGTRRVLIGFVTLMVAWFAVGRVQDRILLSQHWNPLPPEVSGLTVVGTLDGRASLDRNFFRIVQANKTTRVELTDYGWKTIFSGENASLSSQETGDLIEGVLQVDNQAGYAMMEPFLRYGIARWMEDPKAAALLSPSTPVQVTHDDGKIPAERTTLGALIDKYKTAKADKPASDIDKMVGGSASGREVEHGRTIPGDTLAKSCPIVLTGKQFEKAELEEQPGSVLVGKMFRLKLFLNKEGRSRFYQWSRNHLDENLVFVLKGQVLTAGKVKQVLDVNEWEISNIRDAEAAKALTDYVNRGAGGEGKVVSTK